ncbi:competence protein CoiA [Arthrobacter sp. 35W]|uniref:competence protein CoiA n=1 Tax=Arthrobacter sp. 35W TaxID=1132441 RepID=UPI000423D0BC|nr:competence protein CoiA family protein [Arthrobacter sp. 35W]
MPLIAMLDGERVDATTHTPASWADLQASEDRKRLVMPVCNIWAVAKTRGQATRFFAHYRLTDCGVDHGGESPQHLAMKEALARGIGAVPGWRAVIEYPHPSREWIIDVLAESDDRRHRVAFEVQLSSQTPADYFRRTQRYFDSNVFPVWLVPRALEYSPVHLPVVITGFGKTSEVPENPADILDLEIKHNLVLEQNTLGGFVTDLLSNGPRWKPSTPQKQQADRDEEQGRRIAAQLADAERIAKAKDAVEDMNRHSMAPERTFVPHTVHTEAGPFVWATLTCCWKCRDQMMVWEAWSGRPGEQYSSAPQVTVKRKVGPRRYQNHPDVHQAVDTWIVRSGAAVTKARIETRSSQGKGESYSAFVCPRCRALIGQVYVAQINAEHWSVISAPLLQKI